MTWEENREFSLDKHGMVKPLAEHYVGVGLDYWQMRGPGEKGVGPLQRKCGAGQMDTAGQFIVSPTGEMLGGYGRCWKNGKGYEPRELLEYAAKHPADESRRNSLRLSWFLMDPAYYKKDIENEGACARFCTFGGAVTQARERRRPLVRVDGPAIEALESQQEFLVRHVRQFWWLKGDPKAPARLVVFHTNEFTAPGAHPLSTPGDGGKCPAVMAEIDLSSGLDLPKVSPALDECWRKYMGQRPENITHHKGNKSYREETEVQFRRLDESINRLAADGKILAPGGRPLIK
jgi:hypothetical protein